MNDIDLQNLIDRVAESEKDIADLKLIDRSLGETLEGLKKEIGNKVSYKVFTFVTMALISLIGGLLYIIYEQNVRLDDKVSAMGQHVYTIEGSMDQILNHAGITSAKE